MKARINRAVVSCLLTLTGLAWVPLFAQVAYFDVPSEDAGKSIPELGRQAGVQIIAPGELLHGLVTPAIKGSYDVHLALGMMLKGTDLVVDHEEDAVITITARNKGCDEEDAVKNVKRKALRTTSLLALLFGAATVPSCQAQDATAAGQTEPTLQLETIVVTAMRDKSDASKTPVALTALTGDKLAINGVSTVSALSEYVPNLSLSQSGDAMRITIRGVTSQDASEKGDPSAAFMLDNIYISRPQAQNVSFYDVARVEVLRGPQGTLYGRNTTAGVVNVITNEPGDMQDGALNVTVGDYATRIVDGFYNLPVNDWLSLRAAFSYNHHDPYLINNQGTGYNPGDDRDDFSARLSAKMKFSDDAILVLRGDDSQMHTVVSSYVEAANFYQNALGTGVWKNPDSETARTVSFIPPNGGVSALLDPDAKNSTWGISADFNWNLGPFTLTYEGSHRYFKRDDTFNNLANLGALVGARGAFRGDYNQDSHELRVSFNDGGPLKAQAGLYYFKDGSDIVFSIRDLDALFGFPHYYLPQGPTKSISKAAFGQAGYEILKGLRLTGGLRYSEDTKSRYGRSILGLTENYNPATDLIISFNAADYKSSKMTWRVGAEYDITPDAMWFGTVSTGYKAGGFNDGCIAGSHFAGLTCTTANGAKDTAVLFYKPEALTSYETGVKSSFFNRRVQVNATFFYYDYSNLQLSGIVFVQGAPQTVVTNATTAKVYGFELEGEALLSEFDQINYSASSLDAHYGDYSPNGVVSWAHLPLDNSPKWTFSLGYDRTFKVPGGELVLGLFTRWTGKYDLSIASEPIRWTVPSYHKSDASLRYQPDDARWNIQVFAKNLEDKVVPAALPGVGSAFPTDPRTYGVRLSVKL